MTKDILDKINKFTRRQFSEDELYTFSVILCDNDIDRDCERFSDDALKSLSSMFIGKTGIFDHDPSTANQNARIFDTELVTDENRRTKTGAPYKFLRAMAYMIRTDNNRDLIAEIDGGIKKEVSISCSAAKRVCSVCGCDKSKGTCSHVKGKLYGDKVCHVVLDGISDAYEWSFVAVPAQVNAGVTKKFTDEGTEKSACSDDTAARESELRAEIRRLAFIKGGRAAADAVGLSAKTMNIVQLETLKKAYQKFSGGGTEVQLIAENDRDSSASYKL